MCGIFGYFDSNKLSLTDKVLEEMGKAIQHRGPDEHGVFHDKTLGIALGNQRLSIMDIDHGKQPFVSGDGNIIVVQNGEVFNHIELAQELALSGYACKTKCDTEVILNLYEKEGIECIPKLNGMFAIAIYDKRIDSLFLVKDRVGEKPLYFQNENGRTIFASEIKSLLKASTTKGINLNAINQFLAFNYVPPPLTMFKGVFHVKPGHWLKITREGISEHCWWDLAAIEQVERSESEWIEGFNEILSDATKIRMRADVSFGAFLSGGVDSSTVVGLMSRHTEHPVRTFCIGFDDPKYDESSFAQEASDRFKTQHIMQKVEPNLIGLWPMATYHCDQPHGDVSFLPTYKVASLASKDVKMVLTGDGADELFAGYDKYKAFFENHDFESSDREFRKSYLNNISLFSDEKRRQLFSSKVLKKIGQVCVDDVVEPLYQKASKMDRINQALYLDTMLLLAGNNLVKPDRMGMAVSLENRAPFLDYRMIEYAFSMPGSLKLKQGETKYLYKKAVSELIGEHLAYRKKQMFTVPIGDWFKDELADLCRDLLFSEQTKKRGIFNYDYVESTFENHINGKENNTREIRALMALEIWFRKFS